MEAKPKESPRERFVRLSQSRTSAVLSSLEKVQALANKNSYEYTDADVVQIMVAISSKVDEVHASLNAGKVSGQKFKLTV